MAWIPEKYMTEVHIIRQDYAMAKAKSEAEPTLANLEATSEVSNRRARAIRMIHEEDNVSVRHLAAMFRCSKGVIREALAAEEE